MLRMLLLILLSCSCNLAHAQWYEVEGQALITGDTDAARARAMENALKKALLVAGASVSSVQQVVNGVLMQDELSVRASGTVNSVDILEETYKDGQISVTIRADIFPQEKQCFAADYKKSMLLTRANIINREQANIGNMYAIETAIPDIINKKIGEHSRFIDAHLVSKNRTNFSRLNQSLQNESIKNLTIELGHMFDSQYVLYSEINDLSFSQENLSSWKFWGEGTFERYFTTTLYLYNSANGEFVFSKAFSSQAPWTFDKRATIDLNGREFWQSEYGRMVDRTLEKAIIDIDESIMCKQTRAKVIRVEGNQVSINLGKHHGVQVNDEFSLLHLNNFTTDIGKTYAGFNVSPFKVKVISVYENNATAIATDERLLGNIQINDLAVKD